MIIEHLIANRALTYKLFKKQWYGIDFADYACWYAIKSELSIFL